MSTPSNPDFTKPPSDAGAPYPQSAPPAYPGSSASYPPPGPGYGYAPRPAKPFTAAWVLAALGLLVEAVGSLLYWPTDDYSKTMARAAVLCTGGGFVILAVAAFVALASRPAPR